MLFPKSKVVKQCFQKKLMLMDGGSWVLEGYVFCSQMCAVKPLKVEKSSSQNMKKSSGNRSRPAGSTCSDFLGVSFGEVVDDPRLL